LKSPDINVTPCAKLFDVVVVVSTSREPCQPKDVGARQLLLASHWVTDLSSSCDAFDDAVL